MDKYVLVGQDQYDTMVRKSKVNDIQPPPPGLPPSDSMAKNGIPVSDREAQEIDDNLLDIAYESSKSEDSNEAIGDNLLNNDWKQYWQDSKK